MQLSRPVKEVKKNSTSPLKTPERALATRKVPIAKKSPIKSKLAAVPRNITQMRSSGNVKIFEGLKLTSVNIVQGCEKLRRIIGFSTYRPCFQIIKNVYTADLQNLEEFLSLKTMLKSWEALKTNTYLNNKKDNLSELVEDYQDLIYPDIDIGRKQYKRKLMEQSLNGIMSFYCQTMDINQHIENFYMKKLAKKAFEGIYMTSKYDNVIDDFVKVKILPKVLKAWNSLTKLKVS
ncbi:hypothetical protein SteCoe_26337 [Stentor coeruleus]|uniref:Uncharacterized protein n=1 Tax=Stentor coeruleus TaxID=5963 RepID=A0A1R2BD59_9CILI|nr:hypothetical protein SteCoe_26337 [Stentor coeruleus]